MSTQTTIMIHSILNCEYHCFYYHDSIIFTAQPNMHICMYVHVHNMPSKIQYAVPTYILMHRYQREFGFTIPSRDIRVDDIRVRAMGRACSHDPTPMTTPTTNPPVLTKVSHDYTRIYTHAYMHIIIIHARMQHCCATGNRILTPVSYETIIF